MELSLEKETLYLPISPDFLLPELNNFRRSCLLRFSLHEILFRTIAHFKNNYSLGLSPRVLKNTWWWPRECIHMQTADEVEEHEKLLHRRTNTFYIFYSLAPIIVLYAYIGIFFRDTCRTIKVFWTVLQLTFHFVVAHMPSLILLPLWLAVDGVKKS